VDMPIDLQAHWKEMQVVWEQPLTLNVYITVRCLCGHKKVLRWSSAPSFVDTIKFHTNHICYDCWKIFKRNENIAISEILGLPKLRGSRKQYIAGMNIRAEFAIKLVGNGFDEQNIKCFLEQQKEAGWWIDNKHKL